VQETAFSLPEVAVDDSTPMKPTLPSGETRCKRATTPCAPIRPPTRAMPPPFRTTAFSRFALEVGANSTLIFVVRRGRRSGELAFVGELLEASVSRIDESPVR
jgi:hypothetical protein